jgi:hypothetical protein
MNFESSPVALEREPKHQFLFDLLVDLDIESLQTHSQPEKWPLDRSR